MCIDAFQDLPRTTGAATNKHISQFTFCAPRAGLQQADHGRGFLSRLVAVLSLNNYALRRFRHAGSGRERRWKVVPQC